MSRVVSKIYQMGHSAPDDDEQFKRMRRTWMEHGDEVVAFRRKDVPNDFKWQQLQNEAAAIYGKRG